MGPAEALTWAPFMPDGNGAAHSNNAVLEAYVRAGELKEALHLYGTMAATNEADAHTVGTVMRALMHHKVPMFSKAVHVYQDALGACQPCAGVDTRL